MLCAVPCNGTAAGDKTIVIGDMTLAEDEVGPAMSAALAPENAQKVPRWAR